MDGVIAGDDPSADDVRALLGVHLAFNRAASPPEDVHALDIEELMEAFAPARALYAQAEFVACDPFGDYFLSPNSTFMTRPLEDLSPASWRLRFRMKFTPSMRSDP